MNKVRILSFCRLDNEDVRFIRKQNGFDEETEQLKNTVAQLQEQVQAMQNVIEQLQRQMQAIQKILEQPVELQKNSPPQPRTSPVKNEQPVSSKNTKQFPVIQETGFQNFEWIINKNGEITIKKYIGKDENVVIPRQIKGRNVTSIGENAFYKSRSKSITIPDSVRLIDAFAFNGCSSLENITIPDSVNSIGNSAFYDCSNITSLVIPNSVIQIGHSAFSGCSKLKCITIPYRVNFIGDFAFYNCHELDKIIFKGRRNLSRARFGKYWDDGCYAQIVFEP